MQAQLNDLKARLLEAYDLKGARALMFWDQSTYMPPGGAAARSRQTALMALLYQEKMSDPALGRLLDKLRPYEESLPYDSDDASLIRVTRNEYERRVKVPPVFMARYYNHVGDTYQVWTKARPANNFPMVQPYLEKMLDLSREWANYSPGYEHIADPLIDIYDEGMQSSTIRELFDGLRQQLLPIKQTITSQAPAEDACLRQHFPEEVQLAFGQRVVKQLGFDFERGRQDKTHHPFMTKFSLGDVRITTRAKEQFLGEALFSTIHESGHAMYEQGINIEFEGTPLAEGTSYSVHESQSRLWENVVGRSRGFWQHFYPQLQATFPAQLGDTPLETFYRAINKVEPSLIRTDADEVTYNLHVMLRFDFELALLDGELSVRDLPEAWQARYASDLGVTPPDDRDGVLQDVHWFSGTVGGAFQSYTLGNILAAQFYEAALKAHPEIPEQIEQGQYSTLHAWLIEKLYQHGKKFTTAELVKRITGGPISIEPYIRYLRHKYGELYTL